MRQVGQLPRIIAWCTVNETLNSTYVDCTHFVVSLFICSELSLLCVVKCKLSGGYESSGRMSATTWISLSFSVSFWWVLYSTYEYLIDEYFFSGWSQELAGMMSVAVSFRHMLNCNESICLVIVMSRKFIFLFCSSSREKDSFGLTPLRSVRTECMLGMIWSLTMRSSTYLKYSSTWCLLWIFNRLLYSWCCRQISKANEEEGEPIARPSLWR